MRKHDSTDGGATHTTVTARRAADSRHRDDGHTRGLLGNQRRGKEAVHPGREHDGRWGGRGRKTHKATGTVGDQPK